MTSERLVTLAIIGRGKWGQNYINTLNAGVQCASLPQKNILGRDYKDYLRLSTADGIIIATPTNTHYQVAVSLLESELLHLLIEKPVTQTLEEALKLRQISEKLKASIMVGHIQLYDPAYQEMVKNRNLVGKIKSITFKGLKSNIRPGVTTLQEWGPHPIYLCMDFLGRTPSSVSAKYSNNINGDNVFLTLNFDEVQATAEIGYNFPEKKREFTIMGDKGSITLDWSGQEKTLVYNRPDYSPQKLFFSTTNSPLKLQILEFAGFIKGEVKPKSPLSQGVEVMRIIDLAEESLKQGNKPQTLS